MTIKEFKIQLALGSLSKDMKYDLADDPNTSIEILTALSKDKDWWIRYRVAMNPNTPVEILTILSKDKSYNVRYWVVDNTNTPKKY